MPSIHPRHLQYIYPCFSTRAHRFKTADRYIVQKTPALWRSHFPASFNVARAPSIALQPQWDWQNPK
jgi:hypothetical protein